MWIYYVILGVCYFLASVDQTKDAVEDKPHMKLREDMEFADMVTAYLKGEDL